MAPTLTLCEADNLLSSGWVAASMRTLLLCARTCEEKCMQGLAEQPFAEQLGSRGVGDWLEAVDEPA